MTGFTSYTQSAPTIHWKDALNKGGNGFSLKPQPTMLLEGGVSVLRSFKKPGRTWGHEKETEFFNVVYDRDYVSEYILNNVVSCFPNITHVAMRELFTEALKLRKEREEKRQSEQV